MLHMVKSVSKRMRLTVCHCPEAALQRNDNSLAACASGVDLGSDATSTEWYSSEDDENYDDKKIHDEVEQKDSNMVNRQEVPPMTLCQIATFLSENTSDSMDAIIFLNDDDDQLDDELSTTSIHLDIFDKTTIPEPDLMCTEDPPTHYLPQIDAWELEHYDSINIHRSSN